MNITTISVIQKYRYVGVNTNFERQFYLPQKGLNLKDGSHVISLSVYVILNAPNFKDLSILSKFK